MPRIAKDGIRSIVRVGYDGRVFKTFRGTHAAERFANEIHILQALAERGCDFVPRLLEHDAESLTITTTNCGRAVESISDEKAESIFAELRDRYGVIHDDPFPRNITYHGAMGRFCVIDFELATLVDGDETAEAATALTIEWCGLTVAGHRKPGNEDALAAFASDAGWATELPLSGQLNLADEGVVLAVSDGMGGKAGGGYASHLTVNELRRFLPAQMGTFRSAVEPLRHLEGAVCELNAFVNRMGEANPAVRGMGATLVCGLFNPRDLHFAHVGDSRIYRFYNGHTEQLTFDDSRVGRMFRRGDINEREARTHPGRNVLDQVIGNENSRVKPQVGSIQLRPEMWFLFCSDGVIDGLWNSRIEREFARSEQRNRTVEATARVLMQEAVEAAGKDDTTLFVVRVCSADTAQDSADRPPTNDGQTS